MTTADALQPAFAALDRCREALSELDAKCCEPGRSPSMKALGETLTRARTQLATAEHDDGAGAMAQLEEA
ncbi:MAG TPA: hypothetical protein VLL51_04600, partial [Gemmatimonadales bacterium]|nr:hypothetical protein [Gemmatimonadales bacterium]